MKMKTVGTKRTGNKEEESYSLSDLGPEFR